VSDAFFKRVFGDSEPTHLGSGWVSGVASVFFGMLGVGGVLVLLFPSVLTLPEARALYPIHIMRVIIQATIAAALVLGAISAILRQRRVLGLTGAALGLIAVLPAQARRCPRKSDRKSASASTGSCWTCW